MTDNISRARNIIERGLPCMPDQMSAFMSRDIAQELFAAGLLAEDESDRGNRLDRARDTYHAALAESHAAVIAACPGGSDHHVIQHRDGKPPWCPHCGRNSIGTQIKEKP